MYKNGACVTRQRVHHLKSDLIFHLPTVSKLGCTASIQTFSQVN